MKNTSIYFVCALIAFTTNFSFAQQIVFNATNNNTTNNTCSGFIIDSGGQGGNGYSNNENVTITICPDTPGEKISINFGLFDLDTYDDNPDPNASNLDRMTIYDGATTSANTLGTYTGNTLQGAVVLATAQNTSGCLTLQFVSNSQNTNNGKFAGSFSCETPCSPPISGGFIVNGITTDSIRVCIGQTVNFQEQGSSAAPGFTISDYKWDFADGTTVNSQNASHAFEQAGFYRVQLIVTDDNDDNVCVNTNLTDLKVLVSTYPSFADFPADTSLCLGEGLSVTVEPDTSEVPWVGSVGTVEVDQGCLVDTQLGVPQNIPVLQTGFVPGSTISNINDLQSICLNMEHSYIGDLVISIICPNGQSVVMHQQQGTGTDLGIPVIGGGVNAIDCNNPATQGTGYDYCFTPQATQTWGQAASGGTLPAGDYASVNSLAGLIGCPTNGTWTLSVSDNYLSDDGTIFSFALNLDAALYDDVPSFTPNIGVGSDSSTWNGSSPFVTSISSDGNTMNILPTIAGTYTYNYELLNDFGCTYDSTLTVTVKGNPIPFMGNDTSVCPGSQINFDVTYTGITHCDLTLRLTDDFSNGWQGDSLRIIYPGFSQTYTLVSGASVDFDFSVPAGETVTVEFTGTGSAGTQCNYAILDESNNIITSQTNFQTGQSSSSTFVSTCIPELVYQWSPASSDLSSTTVMNPTYTVNNVGTLSLTVHPIGHPTCVTSNDITFSFLNDPDPGIDSTITYCPEGAPVDLITFLGGTPETNGTWKDPSGNVVAMPFNPTTMPFGSYTYVVQIGLCSDSSVVTVNELIIEITDISTSPASCYGSSDGSANVSGVNFDQYSLNGGVLQTVNSPFTIPDLPAGNYSFTVSNLDGCSRDSVFTITQPDSIEITFKLKHTSCYGFNDGNVLATVTGGILPYTYNWVSGVDGNQSGWADSLFAGNYFLQIQDANNCLMQDDFEITQPDNVIPVIAVDTASGCKKHQVDFINLTQSNQIATTVFDFGDGKTQEVSRLDSAEHLYHFAGLYDINVTMTTDTGCVYKVSYPELIEVFEIPEADFFVTPSPASMFNPIVDLKNRSSDFATQFQWSIPEGKPETSSDRDVNQVKYPQEIAEYPVTLIVTTEHGCIDSISKTVYIENEVYTFAPNAFTPNGDQYNNTWKVFVNGIDVTNFSLTIFNRWGQIVWRSNDVEIGWDGTYNGNVCSDGVYTWKIECSDKYTDERYNFKGYVNLLK